VAAPDSFGARLRAERERRKITLESIAANTNIRVGLLADLEHGDVSRWPSGIFRRSFVREYATAIGLDPDEVLAEFTERHPDPEAPFIGPAPLPGNSGKVVRLHAVRPARAPVVLRLTLAEADAGFSTGRLLAGAGRRLAAAAWDVAVTMSLALLASLVVDRFWAPLALSVLAYYAISIVILGNTPGVCLFARHQYPAPPSKTSEEGRVEERVLEVQ
jgi:transcriptional regulator with XRE-family HTH domain